MSEEFEAAVEDGLRLAKRIYFGKDRAVAPPKPGMSMERSSAGFLPTAPMMYAVIIDPAIVDNPDMPSYQPHVHGRCDSPALIPLQMNNVSLEVNCVLDTAFVTATATWRVHCVMGSRSCYCRIAVPIGEEGSITSVEVDLPRRSYSTELIAMEGTTEAGKVVKLQDGSFLKSNIFILTIPQIDGGTNVLVKLRWSQKLTYHDGQFTLNVPFNFPEYVTPAAKKIPKREKIQLNVNSGPGVEVLCKTTSHPLKERLREAGKLVFLYDSDVLSWSRSDLTFAYSVSSDHTCGGVFLNPPLLNDVDGREMFCCYLYPGRQQSGMFFRKEVVFLVDISGSMRGKPLDDIKNALYSALERLHPEDLFNVIAFNGEMYTFSSSLESATTAVIEKVNQWISMNFVAGGSTNMELPLSQAIKMLSDSRDSIPMIFLITDGSVEDEKLICDNMKTELANSKNVSPRIYTLGIGTFCNHYFLRMLSTISRGHHCAATDVDSLEARVGGLFARASSTLLANITFENLDELDDLEVFPSRIPDLSSQSPLIVSGRYRGKFPENLKVKGILANTSSTSLDLKVQEAKDLPIHKIVVKHQIEILTAEAWYSESEELIDKIAKLSIQNSIVSEFTGMIFPESDKEKKSADSTNAQKPSKKLDHHQSRRAEASKPQKILNLGLGFGNLTATAENTPPGSKDIKPPDAAEIFAKAASNCCGNLCGKCCCVCCIQTCSKLNDQCAIALTQLCGALVCLGCYACCCGVEGR